MEKDLFRKTKQIKRLNYAHSYFKTSSKNKQTPNWITRKSQNSEIQSSFCFKPSSTESNDISQANSTIMYSCEKIKIELNFSSEDQSLKCKSDDTIKGKMTAISKENTQDITKKHLDACKMNPDIMQVAKKPKTLSIPDDMFSMDDSILAEMDLSCYELEGLVNDKHSNSGNKPVQPDVAKISTEHNSCDKQPNSPDIFNTASNKEEEDEETEDHPWDMSITVDNADKKEDNAACNVSAVFHGLSEVVFSTWVSQSSPKLTQNEGAFKSLLKKALTNNGQKPKVSLSSPRALFSEDSELRKSSFFGLPILVKQLIKKYKGIAKLYGKLTTNIFLYTLLEVYK